jgi:hypothetical protein
LINQPWKISESIDMFFWVLHKTGRAAEAGFVEGRGFLAFPVNVSFSLWLPVVLLQARIGTCSFVYTQELKVQPRKLEFLKAAFLSMSNHSGVYAHLIVLHCQ